LETKSDELKYTTEFCLRIYLQINKLIMREKSRVEIIERAIARLKEQLKSQDEDKEIKVKKLVKMDESRIKDSTLLIFNQDVELILKNIKNKIEFSIFKSDIYENYLKIYSDYIINNAKKENYYKEIMEIIGYGAKTEAFSLSCANTQYEIITERLYAILWILENTNLNTLTPEILFQKLNESDVKAQIRASNQLLQAL